MQVLMSSLGHTHIGYCRIQSWDSTIRSTCNQEETPTQSSLIKWAAAQKLQAFPKMVSCGKVIFQSEDTNFKLSTSIFLENLPESSCYY